MSELPVECARIDWRDQVTPVSAQFDDVYFSSDSGIDETRYVFLEQNDLPQRLRELANQDAARLVIGETGFGTGLNFLAAWQLRDQLAPDCLLHFVSVEKYPLSRADLGKALSHWPELAAYADQLLRHYPTLTPGWHRISLCAARVEISLFLGDALAAFNSTEANIDAWFLDGFAPAKNPAMWSQPLAASIARLSHPGTTLSTFSAAAQVREHFAASGFELSRVPGYGRKRHMLRGVFGGQSAAPVDAGARGASQHQATPTHAARPWFIFQPQAWPIRKAIVIGAGLAGAAAAHSLARRDWEVTVIDRRAQPCQGASGNSQGILYAKLSAEPSLRSDFYTAGYLYSLQILQQLCEQGPNADWHASGVLQLACDTTEQQRQQGFLQGNPQPDDLVHPVTAEAASRLAGVSLTTGGLFFPHAGWVRPQALGQQQLNHGRISFRAEQYVTSLRHEPEMDQWQLLDANDNTVASAPVVVFANAREALEFEACAELPLKSIRGQVSSFPADDSAPPRTVICGDSYIAPPLEGRIHLGATFNLDSDTPDCRDEDHQANLHQVAAMAPGLGEVLDFAHLDPATLLGRVGFRCTTPDYLPLIGPLPDHAGFTRQFAALRKDARTRFDQPGEFQPGLFVSLGHGAKGLTSCPLAGELLAAYICDEPMPVSRPVAEAVHPARFVIRDLIRNRI